MCNEEKDTSGLEYLLDKRCVIAGSIVFTFIRLARLQLNLPETTAQGTWQEDRIGHTIWRALCP